MHLVMSSKAVQLLNVQLSESSNLGLLVTKSSKGTELIRKPLFVSPELSCAVNLLVGFVQMQIKRPVFQHSEHPG